MGILVKSFNNHESLECRRHWEQQMSREGKRERKKFRWITIIVWQLGSVSRNEHWKWERERAMGKWEKILIWAFFQFPFFHPARTLTHLITSGWTRREKKKWFSSVFARLGVKNKFERFPNYQQSMFVGQAVNTGKKGLLWTVVDCFLHVLLGKFIYQGNWAENSANFGAIRVQFPLLLGQQVRACAETWLLWKINNKNNHCVH